MKEKYFLHDLLTEKYSGLQVRVISVFMFLLLLQPLATIRAQDNSAQNTAAHETEKRLRNAANKYFENDNFIEAYPLYSQLLSLYPRDPNYNYRFGACLLFTKADKNKAVEYLSFSIKQTSVDDLAYFYLGRALHMNYRFNEAIRTYKRFEQIATSAELKKYPVRHYIEMCSNGKQLLSSLHGLDVLRKKELNLSDYFEAYDMHSNGGTLLSEPDGFKTRTDKDKNVNNVIYLTPDRKQAYFSSYGNNKKNGKDIYRVNRNADGSWGTPENLGTVINTLFDEDYPVYDVQRHTLYFCSKGHNSMGGYDIFKSVYDENTKAWSEPANLDFPINTPDDDILFVPDTSGQIAFFSSTRSSPQGTIDVYKIAMHLHPPESVVIAGNAYMDDGKTPALCKITVKDIKTNNVVGVFMSSSDDGKYSLNLPNGGSYSFTIEASNRKTQSQSVVLPLSETMETMQQDIKYDPSGGLQIKSYQTEMPKDSDYQQAFNQIREQANLDVNVDTNSIKTLIAQSAANEKNNPAPVANNPQNGTQNLSSAGNNGNATNSGNTNQGTANVTQLIQEKQALDDKASKAIDYASDKMDEAQQLQAHADIILNNPGSTGAGNPDSAVVAKNLTYQSKTAEDKGIQGYQLAAEYKSEVAAKQIEIDRINNQNSSAGANNTTTGQAQSNNQNSGNNNSEASTSRISPGDLIRRQAQQVKEDSFQVARTNDDLTQAVTVLKQKSEDFVSEAGQTENTQQKTALLQQADDLKKSKESKEEDIKDNNVALQQMHKETAWLNAKAQKADSIYLATTNNTGSNSGNVTPAAKPELQKEIEDYVAAHKTNYDSVSSDNTITDVYRNEGNGNNENNTSSAKNSTANSGAHSKHSRYRKNPNHIATPATVAANPANAGGADNIIGANNNSGANQNTVAATTTNGGNNSSPGNNNPSGNNQVPASTSGNQNPQVANSNNTSQSAGNNISGNSQAPISTSGNQNPLVANNNNTSSPTGNNTPGNNQVNTTNTGNQNPLVANNNNTSQTAGNNNPGNNQVNTTNTGNQNPQVANSNNTSSPTGNNNPGNNQVSTTNSGNQNPQVANNNNTSQPTGNNNPGNNQISNTTSGNQNPQVTNGNNTSQPTGNNLTGNSQVPVSTSGNQNSPASNSNNSSSSGGNNTSSNNQGNNGNGGNQNPTVTNNTLVNGNSNSQRNIDTTSGNQNIQQGNNSSGSNNGIGNNNSPSTTTSTQGNNSSSGNKIAAGNRNNNTTGNNPNSAGSNLNTSAPTKGTDLNKPNNNGGTKNPNVAGNSSRDNSIATTSSANPAKNNNSSNSGNARTSQGNSKENNTLIASGNSTNGQNPGDTNKKNNPSDSSILTVPVNSVPASFGYKKSTTPHDALLDSLANAVPKPKNSDSRSSKKNKNQEAISITTVQYSDTTAAELNLKSQNYFTAASSLVELAEKTRSKAQSEKDKNKSQVLYNKADSLDDLIFQLNLKGDETLAEANYRQYYTNLNQIVSIDIKAEKSQQFKLTTAKRMLKDADNSYRRSVSERDRANSARVLANKHTYIKSARQDLATAILRQQSAVYLFFQVDSDQAGSTMGRSNSDSSTHFTYSSFMKSKSRKGAKPATSFIASTPTSPSNNTSENSTTPVVAANSKKPNKPNSTTTQPEGNNTSPDNPAPVAETKRAGGRGSTGKKKKKGNAENTSVATNNTAPPATNVSTANVETANLSATDNVFEEVRKSPYSASNPIPIDPQLPMGLIFKVQVGAFKNAIPQNLFQGFQPIIGLTAPEGYIRYSAGLFRAFDKAKDALGKIRGLGYPDAFLIAFFDGKRITIAEALKRLGIEAPPPVASANGDNGNNTTNPTSTTNVNSTTTTNDGTNARKGRHRRRKKKGNTTNNNTAVANNTFSSEGNQPGTNVTSSGDNKVVVIGKNTITPTKKALIDERRRAQKNIKDTIPPNSKSIKDVKGLVYTVQVGSFPKHKDFTRLKKLKQLYTSTDENGAIKYNCGTYSSMEEAKAAKDIILENSSAKDAFIAAYVNGKRISLTKASELLKQGTESTDASNSANTNPGNASNTTSNNGTETDNTNASKTNTTTGNNGNNTELENGSFEEASKTKVVYTVQIASFTGELPIDIANKILLYGDEGIEPHSEKHGVTSYYAGKYANYESANTLQQKLYNEGFKQAVIVAYYHGKKISLQEAQTLNNK